MTERYSITRKEGWRRWVDTPPRPRPERLSLNQIAALGEAAREEYQEARTDWHANFGILKTPQLTEIHDELDLIVATNRQDPDRVKGSAVVDALPGLGKTTIANAFARDFDRAQRRRFGDLTDEGHERLPVFRVGLTSKTTLRTLNMMICQFYAHPAAQRATAAQLTSYAVDCVLSCDTRIGIVDDLHFMNPRRSDGLEVSNHLKWLANELGVTFIFAGVALAERGIFSEGLDHKDKALAQTARRWTRLGLPPFTVEDDEGRRHWINLLKATERQLVLAEHRPGDLAGIADYLFARTTGHIGSYMTLVSRACRKAALTGIERLSIGLLDTVRIDQAAEDARAQLLAEFAEGKKTTRPVARARSAR